MDNIHEEPRTDPWVLRHEDLADPDTSGPAASLGC